MNRLGLVLLSLVVSASAPERVSVEAQPRLWTPDELSTDLYESTPTLSPDGRELIYLRADRDFTRWRLLMSRCEAGRWTNPKPPPFAAPAPVIEADAGYTPDGRGLYFISARHDPANEDFDIWHVSRSADGSWGEPERLPAPVNSPQAELLPRADRNGRLYFGSSRAGGHGEGDIYVAEPSKGGGWRVSNVGPPVSTAANEYEAEVSQDGGTLIVVADRGDRSHLYRFQATASGWVETGQVPASPTVFQVGPLLSPDGRWLLFAQASGDRSGEIFRVALGDRPGAPWPARCGAGG